MKITKQARRRAKALFQSCLANGVLDEQKIRQSVQQVLAAKPRGYGAVLAHFQRLLRLDAARRAARVESAIPLTASQKSAVTEQLLRAYGQGLNIAFGQNPALIGGLRIRVGSDVYDGSVQGRLSAIQELF